MYTALIQGKYIYTFWGNIKLTKMCNNPESIAKLKAEGYEIKKTN